MGFYDDWSYIKSAQVFAQTGHIVYNGWATAMLGWQIPWGTLFIRLFGFSFMAVKLSTFPLAVASVFLFYLIQARFGISPRNALLGTLTLGLSPLFLPLSASFMTDVPGLFVILLCLYLCQRAVAARTSAATIAWLSVAAASNVAGGTVRQIAWLGALVMVPSTAWFLRKRRGVAPAASLLWAGTFASVLYCTHWFARQPYTIPTSIITHSKYTYLAGATFHASIEALNLFLCLILLVYPVLIPWVSRLARMGASTRVKLAWAMAAWLLLQWSTKLSLPFTSDLLATQFSTLRNSMRPPGQGHLILPDPVRFACSLLLVGTALVCGAAIRSGLRHSERLKAPNSWRELLWVSAPFTLGYCALLLPFIWSGFAYDRYLLDLMPIAIIFLIRIHQDVVAPELPLSAFVTAAIFALLAIAGTHDWFAWQRARLTAIREVRAAGIPRTEIYGGFEYDGWTQIESGGHINDPRIKVPAGAYRPDGKLIRADAPCGLVWASCTPAIHPVYTIAFPRPMPDLLPSGYAPVRFYAWLPPFRRTIYVQKIPPGLRNQTVFFNGP